MHLLVQCLPLVTRHLVLSLMLLPLLLARHPGGVLLLSAYLRVLLLPLQLLLAQYLRLVLLLALSRYLVLAS